MNKTQPEARSALLAGEVLSVTDYARRFNTTRAAVNKFIKRGWLQSITSDIGQVFVVGESVDGAQPSQ